MIENGKRVRIHYTLTVNGETVDTSQDNEPLEYRHGAGEILPALERALKGLKTGDREEVFLKAEDAYGPVHQEAILEVLKSSLPEGEEIEVGTLLTARGKTGQPVQGQVIQVLEDKVIVDFNHPLAGKDLFFVVEIIEVL